MEDICARHRSGHAHASRPERVSLGIWATVCGALGCPGICAGSCPIIDRMRIDPRRHGRSSAARLVSRSLAALTVGRALGRAVRSSSRRSSSSSSAIRIATIAAGSRPGRVAGRRPRDGGRRADPAGRSAGRLAADQHLPVADGRARQPHAGGGPVTQVEYQSGQVPAGLPARRPGTSTSTPKSGSITAGSTVVVRQIVGILARRIVCRVQEGDVVKRGSASA